MRPSSPKEFLAKAAVPAFLVTDPVNIRYLSGVPVSFGFLLVTAKKSVLFVDARYRYLADRDHRRGITVRDLSSLVKMMADVPECGFEADTVTVARKGGWKKHFPNTKFVQTVGVLQEFRRAKEDEEITCLKRANRITHELLRRVPAALRTRITEEKLARQLQIWALELGADGMAFEPIVAFGTNTSSPHHHATNRSLKKGHIVQVDVGAKYRGYCADASEVFFTATPTPLQQKMYRLICEAKKKAMAAVKVGASTHELDRIARDVLKREGVEQAFTHSLGHGVGLEIHEGVSVSSKGKDEKLLKNEVITIEPGVYFDGKFGMRVEEMVFVA